MCDHKTRLSENDKRWLKKIKVGQYECSECEREVKMLPKAKLRTEEKPPDDEQC